MKNLSAMAYFARVVEAKSFSTAARHLNVSKSFVSKQVALLERSLGVRLLNRTTRQLSLTEIGSAYFDRCTAILQQAAEAERLVGHLAAKPQGVLRVTAPVAFSTMHVAPALPAFLMRYNQVQIELTLSDRVVDLAQEGYDLAIRIATDLPPNLVARPLAKIRRVVCGSREYFERRQVPATPQELSGHNCLVYTHGNPGSAWRFVGPRGDLVVPVRGSLTLNDNEALWQAVRGGLGIAMLPTFIVGEDLQAGRLRAILSEYVPAEKMIYAVYLSNRNLSPKVRVFIDFLVERFRPTPYWDLDWVTREAPNSRPVESIAEMRLNDRGTRRAGCRPMHSELDVDLAKALSRATTAAEATAPSFQPDAERRALPDRPSASKVRFT